MRTLFAALVCVCAPLLAARADEKPHGHPSADDSAARRAAERNKRLAEIDKEIAVLKAALGAKAKAAPSTSADDDWWKRAIVEDSLGRPLTPAAPAKKPAPGACPCGDACKCPKCPATKAPAPATKAPAAEPVGALRAVSGRLLVPTGTGSYRYADGDDGGTPSCAGGSCAPRYLPAYPFPTSQGGCANGRCPTR